MSHINDQNILLKAQLSAAGAGQQVMNNHTADPSQVEILQNQVQALVAENSHQKTKIMFYESENSRIVHELEAARYANNESSQLKSENVELTEKIAVMSKDQEDLTDLLELLADQELKMKNYRRRLRELHQQVEASDDEN